MNSKLKYYMEDKKLNDYLNKLLILNENINLTRVTDIDQAKLLHLEDSLSALEEINKAPEGLYGDLGSGCGFPGVALAIATGRATYLIDSVKKKMAAVNSILQELNLDSQIFILPERIENISTSMESKFSVLTARALSSLPSLLELASPLLSKDGLLIALKSHVEQDEIDAANDISELTGMSLYSVREFFLSDNTTYRSIYTYKKIAKPTIKLPRRVGMAQKNPLTNSERVK